MYIKKIAHKTLSCDIFYTEILFLLKKKTTTKPLYILPSLPLLRPAPHNVFILSPHAALPDLLGRINLVTGGTEMQLAEGYISLSVARERREHSPGKCRQAPSSNYSREAGLLPGPPQTLRLGCTNTWPCQFIVRLYF